MSKIRGKVIGGTATTPINVDAFIKKSLETGGAINEAIKNNSGVKTITIPEGEVATTSILEMEEGVYSLKGKFRYFPNYAYYDNTINFEREVIACVTKSEGEDDFYGGLVYWERKHLWYFDATANNNTGSQVIITVKYDKGVDDLYDYSVNYTPNKYLERSSYKQREIDDLFYSRLADEEGRTEWYPTIGVMADYVNGVVGTLKKEIEPILLNEELEGILDGEVDLGALNEELETILEGDDE